MDHVDYRQAQNYQQNLLNQVLSEALKRNEEQCRTWMEYKKRHKKVIEGLETYPKELSVNCMIPIGKRALMRGKLIHTNEIMACLGEGYFAKYSAAKAIALCNRRIEWADEMLKSLETERNLYEMRQIIPSEYGAFGEQERRDLVEHWDEKSLHEWRVKHRQKEKEYHQKLAQIRSQETKEIRTEEDIFRRLDELEIEEELADEMNRLEEEESEFTGEDLEENEVYEESDEESSFSDEPTAEMIEEELQRLKDIRSGKIISNVPEANTSTEQTPVIPVTEGESDEIKRTKSNRRISFAETPILEEPEEIASTENTDQTQTDTKDDEDILKIEFTHSSNAAVLREANSGEIESPSDIYRVFSRPKSILKKTNSQEYNQYIPAPVDEDEDEDDEEQSAASAYESIVKDVKERKPENPAAESPIAAKPKSQFASRFKMERSTKKQSKTSSST